MKKITSILKIFFLCFLAAQTGCQTTSPRQTSKLEKTQSGMQNPCLCNSFAADKIEIMPLTELTITNDSRKAKIKAYVGLLDKFNCQQKWPGIFRFELYKKVPRSPEPKGRRVFLWPNIDLADPVMNNRHWRDFLRAYEFDLEFDLEFEPAEDQDYILQVTCLAANNKRPSAEVVLKPQKK